MGLRLRLLRFHLLHGALPLLVLLVLASPVMVSAQNKMFMQASFNPTQTDLGVSVAITGRVFNFYNQSISNAVISIQVNNPQGSSIHVAIAYTGATGTFQDVFLLAPTAPGGNYTAYLVADKPGYDTARLTLNFTYSTPDFSVQSSLSSLSLQQGQTGSVAVTILSLRGFNQPVNLTSIDQPAGVTLQFKPSSLIPSGTAAVNVTISDSTQPGNYTVTLLAVSGSLSHKASFQLEVTQAPYRADYTTLASGTAIMTVAVILIGLLVRTRKRRRRKEAALQELMKEAAADSGYVATARVIARLEELKAMGKVDEETYERLRREYEKRLEKSK
jgi:uncharacterized membrane protein